MKDSNAAESMDVEGLPELEGHPPGIDVDTDQETMMVPRDHPVAAGDDPAYPTTRAEERVGESVGERAARENPDVGAEELGVGGGVQGRHAVGVAEDRDATAMAAEPGMGLSAEEAAVHARSDSDDI